jgi:hypothetical protein
MRPFISLCAASLLFPVIAVAQDDGYFGPITRWSNATKPVEPGTVVASDSLQKLANELAEVKNRLKVLEESQQNYTQHTRTQFQVMNDSLKLMQAHCDRLQQQDGGKGTVHQAGAVMPVTKPVDDNMRLQELMMKQFEDSAKRMNDLSNQVQEMIKVNVQVQNNTRDLNDLKKKYEAQERDLIQAQSDIGKLQQDLARMVRPSTTNPSVGDNTRSSMSLPLPPGSGSNTNPSTTVTPAQSAVKLVNSYPMSVTVVVDGQYHTLRSGETLTLNKSPGYFTYEVLGIQGNTLRTLGTAEVLTLQIVAR